MASSSAATASTTNQDAPIHVPEWLESLMRQDSNSECAGHAIPSIVTNRYCIECNNATCHYCVRVRGEHRDHTVLTMYKYEHCNVLLLDQMDFLIDCSRIQTYLSNKKWVISLIPLPHTCSGDPITAGDGGCSVCKRMLTMGHIHCSIFCKFESNAIKRGNGLHKLLSAGRMIEARERALNQCKKKRRTA